MKKILIAEKSSKFVSISEIDNDDLVIGIVNDESSQFEGEIHIVVEDSNNNCYRLVSIEDYMIWKPSLEAHRFIQDLIRDNSDDFDFYLLDDWTEIKEFIK